MKIVFMGTPEFAVASLDQIHKSIHDVIAVVTAPDKPSEEENLKEVQSRIMPLKMTF